MEKYRFLLSGSGGQGVISMAIILAEAAVMHEGLTAVQTQSYGPEARGGSTRSDVIISTSPIYFPKVLQPNILVALTNDAAGKYSGLIRPGGMFLYDSDLVQPSQKVDARVKGLPMYKATMDTLGKAVAYNITVLGALATLSGALSHTAIEKSLQARFAPQHHEANKKALYLGEELAKPYLE